MKPRPVRQGRAPGYPTRREVLAGAASFVLVSLASGGFVFAEAAESGEAAPAGTIVAPVFEHGEGRGTIGCAVAAPPTFLSEEEGMQILREELAKHGIELKPGGKLEDVQIPLRTQIIENVCKENGQSEIKMSVLEVPHSAKPLQLDGTDSDKKVAVAFASHEDYFDLGGVSDSTSAITYEFKNVAEEVAKRANQQGKDRVFLGVFYDPVAQMPRESVSEELDWATVRERQVLRDREGSMSLLRQQAQDFAAWLKKQGAIP